MYDPSANPVQMAKAATPSRYAYLVTRLRSRQITMEEATELFALQQSLISQASVMSRSPPPPPDVGPAETVTPIPTPSAASGTTGAFSDENIALGLLAMGAGIGLLAAVLKRAQEGPKPSK